ncbi:MAG: ABC transporter permease, partial [Clostridiales bacterium]|nr:ABC transporter permease [Clostridiales bacterium]
MFIESIRISLENIVQNKMRSFLTILGILIGVTAIISLITVMQGAISSVNERFDALGAGKLLVQAPGTALKRGLNDNDMRLLEQLDNINGISPSVTTSSSVQRGGVVEDNVRIEGRNDLYFKYNPDS